MATVQGSKHTHKLTLIYHKTYNKPYSDFALQLSCLFSILKFGGVHDDIFEERRLIILKNVLQCVFF